MTNPILSSIAAFASLTGIWERDENYISTTFEKTTPTLCFTDRNLRTGWKLVLDFQFWTLASCFTDRNLRTGWKLPPGMWFARPTFSFTDRNLRTGWKPVLLPRYLMRSICGLHWPEFENGMKTGALATIFYAVNMWASLTGIWERDENFLWRLLYSAFQSCFTDRNLRTGWKHPCFSMDSLVALALLHWPEFENGMKTLSVAAGFSPDFLGFTDRNLRTGWKPANYRFINDPFLGSFTDRNLRTGWKPTFSSRVPAGNIVLHWPEFENGMKTLCIFL